MRPRMRLASRPTLEHRTVFHGEEVRLFFRNRSSGHEDEIVFYNEDFTVLINQEPEIYEENGVLQDTHEWLLMESIILLVLNKLFLLWARLNETIGRYFE